jgi:hypothetical protein
MADQKSHDDQNAENARGASGASSKPSSSHGIGSSKAINRDHDPLRERKENVAGDQDDVAEDRNLSGASTWLTLPDQPKGDDDSTDTDKSSDTSDRQSKR